MPSSSGRTQHPRTGPELVPLRGLPGCETPEGLFVWVHERNRGAVTTMQETVELGETEQAAAAQPAHEGSRLASAWSLLKQAVKGTQQDYTEGSLSRAVFLLSVPMILEMVMESVFGVLDVYFVGR